MNRAKEQNDHAGSHEREKVQFTTTFGCPYCGVGAERYNEVFDHGNCKQCGGPLEKYWAVVSELSLTKIKRSVFILSHPESEANVDAMVVDLAAEGIDAIRANDIIEGTAPGRVKSNLAFLMRNTVLTLVVASPHFNDDYVTGAILDDIFLSEREGKDMSKVKVAPVVFGQDSFQDVPSFVGTRTGLKWDGEGSAHGTYKSKMIRDLKAMISAIPTDTGQFDAR